MEQVLDYLDARGYMERMRSDRRHPRIRVEDLRRDLREADEDLFRLESVLKTRGGNSWLNARVVGGAVLIAIGLGSVLSMAKAPAKPLLPALAARPMLESSILRGGSNPLPVALRYSTSQASPVQRKAIARPTARRPSTPSNTRPAPRPVSPGEFGRAARG